MVKVVTVVSDWLFYLVAHLGAFLPTPSLAGMALVKDPARLTASV